MPHHARWQRDKDSAVRNTISALSRLSFLFDSYD